MQKKNRSKYLTPQKLTDNVLEIAPFREPEDFLKLPTSPATDIMYRALGAGADIVSLKYNPANHNRSIEVQERGNSRRVISTSENAVVYLELADIMQLAGSNKGAKKILTKVLASINEQAYSAGSMRRDYIQFPTQDLVDIGAYSDLRAARRGFDNAMDTLTSFKVGGELKEGKNSTASAIEVLFTGSRRERGVCTVFLNDRIDWGFIAHFYTLIPSYYYALPNKASDLLLYISMLARQNVRQIEKEGGFNISLRAVQSFLNLPKEEDTTHPKQDIRDPIIEAIKAIKEQANRTDFTVTIIADSNAPVPEYLNSGYLHIEMEGEYKDYFVNRSKEVQKEIAQYRRQQEQLKIAVEAKIEEKKRKKAPAH